MIRQNGRRKIERGGERKEWSVSVYLKKNRQVCQPFPMRKSKATVAHCADD